MKSITQILEGVRGLERPELLQLRTAVADRLWELEEDKHAAVVAVMNMPHGWGETDGTTTDGETDE